MKQFIFLLAFLLLPYGSRGQNIVLNVTGKALVNGQPVKKGDNLSNNTKVVFDDPNTEVKVLSPVGVCIIKSKNVDRKGSTELLDLVKSCIRKNSVATLGTRAWTVNPGKDAQVKAVDALCKTLNVTQNNVQELFRQYITPYCVLEFETPYWQDITQFLQTKYGFKPSRFTGEQEMTDDQYRRIPRVPSVRSLAPIPQSASLKKYCPIPGDQGEFGTCTGWASAYAARTISWAVKNNLTDVQDITNQAFSPFFVYAQIKNKDDANCQNGAVTSKSVEVLKNVGAVFNTDVPNLCNQQVTPYVKQAKAFAIKDFQRLTDWAGIRNKADFDNIKKALADKKPVLASIKCYDSFSGKIWNGDRDDLLGGHAICIIGYDDRFDNGDGTFGAVEMMNSWGVTWGNGGFIHVKYDDLPKILKYAFSLYDDILPVAPPEPPIPLPIQPESPKPQPEPPVQPNQQPEPPKALPEPPKPSPEPPAPPKPQPELPPAPDSLKRMEGTFSLLLNDGSSMQLEGDASGFRNLKLVSAEKMTYNILNTYPAGTLFRICFTSSQPAYVYVISTDLKRSPLAQLFPDPEQNISALLDFNSEVSVSIPDETQYIQMDETPGEDYLCVIYSKDELNIDAIRNTFQNNPNKSFIRTVKEALADKIVDDNEVTFEKSRIAFKAASKTHTAVPIFVKINHR